MKTTSAIRRAVFTTAAAGMVAGGAIGFAAAPASAAPGQTGDAAGMTFDLHSSPNGLPPSCQFPNGDANFVFLSGSYVSHMSPNTTNGDWGGFTAEGTAQFYEDTTPLYQGHL